MRSFDDLLRESSTLHGHLCGGQILGVRMAMIGCREVDIDEPWGCKRLVVHVEMDQMDRCTTDAIQAITGCSPADRTLRFLDYGKMAATFFNVEAQKAVRVAAKHEARSLVAPYLDQTLRQQDAEKKDCALLSEECLFSIRPVTAQAADEDVPGIRSESAVLCEQCGEGVSFGCEIKVGGGVLCVPCARGSYLSQTGRQAALMPEPGLLLVVGRKNVGKTTLIERLVPELSARGYRVGTVKHHHASSPMMVDHEGKDSWRHRRAGAHSVALVSPSQVVLFRDTEGRIPLNALVGYFESLDIVLIEGFRSEPITRIVVRGSPEEDGASAITENHLLATICPERREGEVPLFKPQEIKSLVDLVERKIMGRAPAT